MNLDPHNASSPDDCHFLAMIRPLILLFMSSWFIISTTYGQQKVGVVLSGGGASAVAHIGVLKALEEHNIPIDYITGTSMGGLIAGLYASGYSPAEIEAMFLSPEFQRWAEGKTNRKYTHFFKRQANDPSWIDIKLSPDTMIEFNLPSNIINSTPLDIGLMKIFAHAQRKSGGQFDSLFIPFRCVASDIIEKKAKVFSDGDIAYAVRASMTYPFYLRAVGQDGKLYYDGGLYDNFPVNSLCEDFKPDFIIGSNVSYNYPPPKEGNLLSQFRFILSDETAYEITCTDGVLIEPPTKTSTFNFRKNDEAIETGYSETLKNMDRIKAGLKVRISNEDRNARRDQFNGQGADFTIDSIEVMGLTSQQEKYVLKTLRYNPKKRPTRQMSDLEPLLHKLSSDPKIKSIYPTAMPNAADSSFKLKLNVEREKKLELAFGGNISSRSINQGYLGLKYNLFYSTPFTLIGNTYFGRFYSSGHAGIKMEFNTILPLHLKLSYTINKWDYFQSNSFIIEESEPSFLINRDNFAEAELAFPLGYKGKASVGANFGRIQNEYYQSNNFTPIDTTDVTNFQNTTAFFRYEINSFNRKQYANKGQQLVAKLRYVNGEEETIPGSTSEDKNTVTDLHQWITASVRWDQYFFPRKKLKAGVLLEGVYSNQTFFSNYVATILNAPGFNPIPESETFFQDQYHAHRYAAGGLKLIYSFNPRFDARLEGYLFQPLEEILPDDDLNAYYRDSNPRYYGIGSFMLYYKLPLAQVALMVNYYDHVGRTFSRTTRDREDFSIMIHFGYIMFNKKMHE